MRIHLGRGVGSYRQLVMTFAATLGKLSLSGVQGIKNRGAKPGQVFDVPGNDGELVVKSGRNDQAVSDIDLFSLQPVFTGEDAPEFRNGSRHPQTTSRRR